MPLPSLVYRSLGDWEMCPKTPSRQPREPAHSLSPTDWSNMARAVADHVGNVTLFLAALAALVWTLFTVFGQAVDRPLSDDHTEIHGDKPGTASLTVYIPENRRDDLYQIVRGSYVTYPKYLALLGIAH